METVKRLIAVFVLAFGCSAVANAQYDITFEITDCKDDTMLLGTYFDGSPFAVDTAVNSKGKFVFKNKKKTLDDGIYFIANNKGRYCEFIIYTDQNLKFKTKDENWSKFLQVKGSKNEELYTDYLRKSEQLADRYREILNGRESVSKQEYDSKLREVSLQNDSLKTDFINKYPEHLLSKIFLCAKPVEMPDLPAVYTEDGAVDSVQMRKMGYYWYKQHYLDNIDLSCSGLLHTNKPIFLNNYNYYWETVMKYEKADSVLYYADYWISKAKNQKMFDFLVKDITSRYLKSGVMGHDKVYVGMVDRYLKTGKFTAIEPSDIDRNIQRADTWRNLLIGMQIPDLACPVNDNESSWHHLDELKNKYKILIFWSVECGHCTTEVPKIAEFYNQYKDTYDVGIFGVHTEGDLQQRDEFVKQHNIKWVNTNGLFANYDWRSYFDVEKTPIVYILDTNDKILAKNIAVENIKQIMDILEKGGFDL